ncbi:MAG TPA: hypothetical protein VEH29_11170 [Acidimicrobiales bacterium]|nr:hypothetical protein [Acidimicrobiales bacterium]
MAEEDHASDPGPFADGGGVLGGGTRLVPCVLDLSREAAFEGRLDGGHEGL